MEYVLAWHQAIDEFNSFGIALTNPKSRIDTATAKLMFGFKAGHGPSKQRKYELVEHNGGGLTYCFTKKNPNNFLSGYFPTLKGGGLSTSLVPHGAAPSCAQVRAIRHEG